MADFLSNFSPGRSDLHPKPNELIMGQNKHQEVLAALLLSIDADGARKKEKRLARKAAFAKAEVAYAADFEQEVHAGYQFATEKEKKDAFRHAFSKIHDAVERDREKWIAEEGKRLPSFLNDGGRSYLASICQSVADVPEDAEIVRELQTGRNDAIFRVYENYRDYFIRFAGKQFPSLDEETIADVYQDTWIVIIKYVTDQKFRIHRDEQGREWLIGLRNKASIKTLLTAIGINMLNGSLNALDQAKQELDPNMPETNDDESGFSDEQRSQLSEALTKLGEKCRFLLTCRYWVNLSYKEILDVSGATSEEALRTQTSRCLKYLKKAFLQLRNA